MPVDTIGDLSDGGAIGFNICTVDVHGALAGSWHYRPLEMEEVIMGSIVSNSSEMSVVMKTKDALRRWEYCLLLRRQSWRFWTRFACHSCGKDHDFIYCKFVGSVREIAPPPPEGYESYDLRF